MSVRKNLNLVVASSLLLALVGCGNSSKSSGRSSPETNPICESLQCLSTVDWKIVLQGHVFPNKTKVEINGETVLDECVGKQQYRIDRESAPMSLRLSNFIVPREGHVKIRVADLGFACDQDTTFILNENVRFVYVKKGLINEIVINL